ncbi:MAG: LiaF-related protein [Acidimicrobiia bacterium]|nr:LiaF-related protein [Acidimicrobiia bacterium]
MRWIRRIIVAFAVLSFAQAISALIVRRVVPAYGGEADDDVSLVCSMSGVQFVSQAKALRSMSIVAYMGGAELDLTNAQIVDGAVISIRAVMGGADILVPEGWRVEVTSSAFMGGVGNATNPDAVPETAPLLVVDAVAVMGGVSVRLPEPVEVS